jgi:peptidoglycan/xylan/chitin deacetylase (PgdA/CDA1 family)
VDTETFRVGGRLLPFGTHLYAELPEGTFGVQKIMELCDKHGAKATFFVDVYMHHKYGEAPVAELCQRIDQSGHDVQLHAHPSWLPDKPSELICDFPLNRQIEILAEGKDLIEKWIGKAPVAFRAGAYGANLDTIRALKINGFRVDSSYFPLNRNCELSRQLDKGCLNRSFYIEDVLEIPITTYWLWNSLSTHKNSKVDVNACSWAELRNVVPQLTSSSVDYIVLFLHSFSFVYWDPRGNHLVPSHGPLKRFESLLTLIRDQLHGEFTTFEEASRMLAPQPDSLSDAVPAVSPFHLVPRALTRLLESH